MKKLVSVYVLECINNKYYVGKSLNLERRLKEHFNGRGAKWTQKYSPTRIDKIVRFCIVPK